MRRAILYVRQSDSGGEGTASLSMESQERSLRDYAAAQGWHVVGVEREADLKGWMDAAKRPGLTRVLEGAAQRRFDIVLVYSGSRFARDLILQESWIKQLEESGVELVSQTEPWFRDPLVRRLIGVVNEQYTRELSAHHQRTLRSKTERGLWVGGVAYGYRREVPDRPLVPGPEEEQEAVRTIYRLYAEGHGSTVIARVLNDSDAPTPSGGKLPWHANTVRRMLHNPVYRGHAVLRDVVAMPNAHPCYIPEAVLAEVDRRLSDPTRRSPRAVKRSSSWLEGLVRHECGSPAYLITQRKTGYRYFACKARWDCRRGREARAAHKLEEDARFLLAQTFREMPDVEVLIRRGHARASDLDRDTASRREELQARRDAAQRKLERTARLMIDMDMDEAWYETRRQEALAEREAADRDLAMLPPPFDEATAREALRTVHAMTHADLIDQVADTATLARILRAMGHVVYGPSGTRLEFAPPFSGMFTTQRLRVVPGAALRHAAEG